MLPDHCKDVSIRQVPFELTAEAIAENVKGKKAYTRTEFLILKNGGSYAIIKVVKKNGKALFRPINRYQIVSLPSDTVYVEDRSVDVLNASQMARLSRKHPGKAVVVSGMFNHVSFAKDERGFELEVMDVIPPRPSKLSVLVDRALESFCVDLPVVPKVENIDLDNLARKVETPFVMYPCRASDITLDKKVLFLDEIPEIEGECTLIGCDLSRRIFRSSYRRDIEHVNMCPEDLSPKDGVPRIVKCCRVKEGFELRGSTAIVPWGATVKDVAEAIRALYEKDMPRDH